MGYIQAEFRCSALRSSSIFHAITVQHIAKAGGCTAPRFQISQPLFGDVAILKIAGLTTRRMAASI
jgi:hypothetical protein